MSDAPAPTRAEEGREIRPLTRLEVIALYGHLTMPQLVLRMEIAEAEVARLTAALAEAERERDEARTASVLGWLKIYGKDTLADFTARTEAAESTVSALRERVATLEAALQPFATYAADMPGADFGEGEIGEYYHEGFRRSIRTQDLRAARTALEAPHEDN